MFAGAAIAPPLILGLLFMINAVAHPHAAGDLLARGFLLEERQVITQCGASNMNTVCDAGQCCSQHDYCGNTTDYCDTGCQTTFGRCDPVAPVQPSPAQPPATAKVCGPSNGNAACGGSDCCSQYGYCGNSTAYCGTGCQTAFGSCGPPTIVNCGPSYGNAVCGGNDCCSPAGWCGTTEDYCRSPDCLREFGLCDSSQTPKGTNTSSIPRPKLGSIVYGDDIYHCTKPGYLALTFDDGPYNYTSHILDLLDKYHAKATFFVTGVNNGKGEIDDPKFGWDKIIRRMYAAGHQVASHTWSHADLSAFPSHVRKDEMIKNEMAFRNILGFWPTYMRPPYSSCTDASGCKKDLLDLGYHITYFDLDTDDYEQDSPAKIQTSKNIFSTALNAVNKKTSDFLTIAHDIHQQTAYNLTEYMLTSMQSKGYKPVTVGECLGDPEKNWYRSPVNGGPVKGPNRG